jgi:hypothetical protein
MSSRDCDDVFASLSRSATSWQRLWPGSRARTAAQRVYELGNVLQADAELRTLRRVLGMAASGYYGPSDSADQV